MGVIFDCYLSVIFAAIVGVCILSRAFETVGYLASARILCGWIASPDRTTTPEEFLSMALPPENDALEASLACTQEDLAPPPRPFPRPGFTGSPSSPGSSPKGLKLTFPLAGPELEHRLRAADTLSPRSSRSASPLRAASPLRSASPSENAPRPEEPTHFLTALAAQERRVLELREELKKAENDLVRLKYEWTTNESARKRDEVTFQPLQLRSMSSPVKEAFAYECPTDSPGILTGTQQLITSGRAKPAQRRFEGGKHTRTLSLLTPLTSPKDDRLDGNATKVSEKMKSNHSPLHRVSKSVATELKHSKSPRRPDELVSSGKQLVGDLRDGLWTFIEDLRQVTIGDEATSPARKQAGAKSEKKDSPTKADDVARTKCDGDISQHMADPKLSTRQPLKLTSGNSQNIAKASESPGDAGSDYESDGLSASRKKEALSAGPGDKLAWPSLGSFSPGRLSMTASSLMQDWERSLMEPAEPKAE